MDNMFLASIVAVIVRVGDFVVIFIALIHANRRPLFCRIALRSAACQTSEAADG